MCTSRARTHAHTQVYYNAKQYGCGLFATAEEAAMAHDKKCRQLGKHPSFLNFPDDEA
jgi:hypothetical protein